jgi:hypothetical protein
MESPVVVAGRQAKKGDTVMNTKIKVVLQIIAPLNIGVLVYMLFRLQPPFGIFLPWNKPLIDISFLPNPLYLLVVHVAPNALWTFICAAISHLGILLNQGVPRQRYVLLNKYIPRTPNTACLDASPHRLPEQPKFVIFWQITPLLVMTS